MALVTNIDVCVSADCQDLNITETTGAYSASNLGGWGAPNPLTSNATVANLIVTDPDDVQYTIDLLALTTFPNTNLSYEYTIPKTSIGLTTTETITDGYWIFTYYVVASATTYTKTIGKLFYCNSQICLDQMLADIDADDCDCNVSNNKAIDNYIKAKTFMDALKSAALCGLTTRFATIKKIVDKLCLNVNCTTCN